MLFNETLFIVFQIGLLLLYWLKGPDKEGFVLSHIFPSKFHFIVSHIFIFSICYDLNEERQMFCNPVPWVAIVLSIFVAVFLVYPYLSRKKMFKKAWAFICGLGFFISIYLLIFGGYQYLIFIVLNVPILFIIHFGVKKLNAYFKTTAFKALYFYPAIVLMPFLLFYEVNAFLKGDDKRYFWYYRASTWIIVGVFLALSLRMNYLSSEISQLKDKNAVAEFVINPLDAYLIDLILGAHWKYHTALCLYDGWRPPYHDPVLVFYLRIPFSITYFYSTNSAEELKKTKELYRVFFPSEPLVFKCKCAQYERLTVDW